MNKAMRFINIAAGALALAGVVQTGARASSLTQVQGNVPAVVAKAKFLSHYNPKAKLEISVALRLQDVADMRTLQHDLYDPASPRYHHFLTPASFTTRFAPTAEQVTTVTQFLKQQGLTVTDVTPSRLLVHVTATTAALESAFGVAINNYSYQGQKFYAASTDPSLPSNVGALVVSVLGMDDLTPFKPHSIERPATNKPKASGGLAIQGYSPQQIATAYGWPSLTDKTQAAGVNIAIATAFTFRMQDLTTFWSHYGLPSHTVSVVSIDGVSRVLEGETTLDIERSGAMAPGANIVVYEASSPSNKAFDDMFDAIADDATIDVVSTSWGGSEPSAAGLNDQSLSSIAAEDQDFAKESLDGIPVIAAAGDDGASDGDGSPDVADFPASDPSVLAAGGTSLLLNGDDSIAHEIAWGGAGGADSVVFAEPDFQNGLGGSFAHNTSCTGDVAAAAGSDVFGNAVCVNAADHSRQSSDMAMDADPDTGYSLYFNGRWTEFGGTSFVAPELAGMFAIVTARYRVLSPDTTVRIGNANEILYGTAQAEPGDLNDIINGSNGPAGIFDAGAGWDHPTGWGTPHDADTLITDLANALPH
jgi:kumamolisin